jgi:hypothetical protein
MRPLVHAHLHRWRLLGEQLVLDVGTGNRLASVAVVRIGDHATAQLGELGFGVLAVELGDLRGFGLDAALELQPRAHDITDRAGEVT